ncbi:SRPBCC family protein [Arsenicicoccus piscis]|uniref:Dimethyladenosine transferase n=1 Tax=Arsenicicoccus piscis TaxID=673954 RepID=A0ABQ6HU40_9MICO|nr:SRPBCC family protein [Arsenicicoccus piscis]GMA21912.1 hypothetical protein GCM10025862_39330 [Arsenicicoccus piscis]
MTLISHTRVVPAPAQQIFDLLADPAQHPVIDGSGTVRGSTESRPERLHLGSTFGMTMRIGVPYRIANRVVEFEEGQVIAWRHFAGHRWRYLLEPIDDEHTRVTEEFDLRRVKDKRWIYERLGFIERNDRAIKETLDRLEQWAVDRRAGAY